MLAKLKKGAILAALGLTKQDMINLGIGCLSRRALIQGYQESTRIPSPTDELSMIFKDRKYRNMLTKVGKKIRKQVFGKDNVFDALAGVADEHSVAVRTLRDRLEYDDGELELDDEIMNAAVGDVAGWLADRFNPRGFQEDSQSEDSSSQGSSLLSDLRTLGQHLTVEDVFPEAKEGQLTPVDPDYPWLRKKA